MHETGFVGAPSHIPRHCIFYWRLFISNNFAGSAALAFEVCALMTAILVTLRVNLLYSEASQRIFAKRSLKFEGIIIKLHEMVPKYWGHGMFVFCWHRIFVKTDPEMGLSTSLIFTLYRRRLRSTVRWRRYDQFLMVCGYVGGWVCTMSAG